MKKLGRPWKYDKGGGLGSKKINLTSVLYKGKGNYDDAAWLESDELYVSFGL